MNPESMKWLVLALLLGQTITAETNPHCNFNGICETGEDHGNCLQDCPSGGEDNYCDGKNDLICDPNCSPEEDPDCMRTTTTVEAAAEGDNMMLYLVELTIVVSVAYLVYSENKRRKKLREQEKRQEMIDWIEKQLRDGEDPERLKPIVRSQGYEEELVDYVGKKLY